MGQIAGLSSSTFSTAGGAVTDLFGGIGNFVGAALKGTAVVASIALAPETGGASLALGAAAAASSAGGLD
jgi:hypothetical protein